MFDTLSYHQFNLYPSPYRPSPPPLHPFRLPSCHLYPFHIQPVLFPPPLGYPCTWYLLHLQTQVNNGPGGNELCNRVLMKGDVGIHLLQSHFRYRVLRRWIYPHSILPYPRLPTNHTAGHPVVESAQHPLDATCHHPRHWPVQQYRINHRQVYMD